MLCMVCGAEMILTNVVQDETTAVPGFEHHTFMCSECQDIERRFVFMKQDRNSDTEGMPEQVAPVVPASTAQDEPVGVSDLLTGPMEPDQTVPLQPTQTAPVVLTQTAPADEPTVMVEPSQTDAPVATETPCLGESLRREAPHAQGTVNGLERGRRRDRVVCTIQSRLGQPSFGSGEIGPGCLTDQTVGILPYPPA